MTDVASSPRQLAFDRLRIVLTSPGLCLVLLAVPIVALASIVGVDVLYRHLRWPLNSVALSFIAGILIAAYFGALWYAVSVFTGAATYLTGARAERWTKRELDALGPKWHVFSNVPFLVGSGDASYPVDVDHIVVGPYGILAVSYTHLTLPTNREV